MAFKKFSVFILAVCTICACAPLIGCEKKAEPVSSYTAPTEENEETETADMFRVGVIYPDDPETGSSREHERGIVDMENSLGLSENQIVRVSSVSPDDASAVRSAAEECVGEGCNIIFSVSKDYANEIAKIASEYPEIYFSNVGYSNSNGANFNNYYGKIYQAYYLCGIAAGLKTETGLVGFVASWGSENSEVTSSADAFALGVERVNPDAEIYVAVTGAEGDYELEYSAAERLIALGCDVLAQKSGTDAAALAAAEAGVWHCADSDNETAKAACLTAPVQNWGIYYTMATKAAIEGNWSFGNYLGGMDNGFVAIASLSDNCADGTKDEISAATDEILSGKNIFGEELIDNEGNIVCEENSEPDEAKIFGGIHWYYRNIRLLPEEETVAEEEA